MKIVHCNRGYYHWCPGCKELHPLPSNWTFDGNEDCPTFTPSFKHTFGRLQKTCHYFVTKGEIVFQADCHHELKGQTVLMPDLTGEQIKRVEKWIA